MAHVVEICGSHWPEVRAKTADRAHWLAVVRDGALSFDAVPGAGSASARQVGRPMPW